MYSFFIENDLISSNQSDFKQGDSSINQLLSITRDIYQSLDQCYEVRGVFLDISKASDKVRHKGPVHKLEMVNIRPGVMFLPVFHKDLSLASFCFLFISMIYLMVFSLTQNCLQIISHYLQQCIILKKQQMI